MKKLYFIVKVLFLILILGSDAIESIAQTTMKYVPLESYSPEEEFSDLSSLDQFFSQSKIVGMGESTHGTHEFFQSRHRFFKYLVENHGFNTFFLEADYSRCLRVNNYINGTDDELRAVVKSIGMWPWITQEMAALIEWMRDYNAVASNKEKIRFIGCDMQRINTTITEIDKLIAKHDSTLIDSSIYVKITEKDFFSLSDDLVINKYQAIILDKKEKLETISFEADDKFIYQTLIRHLEQIVESKVKRTFFSYRDLKMAENILYHLEEHPSTKGFYWAHNLHICNISLPHKKEHKSFYTAGGVLKTKLNNEYFIIGQDFVYGTFNAYHIPNYNPLMKVDLEDFNNFVLGPVKVGLYEKELAYQFKDTPESVFYINPSELSKRKAMSLFLHDAGANYVPPRNKNKPSMMLLGEDAFDIVLMIKNTTETKLIK